MRELVPHREEPSDTEIAEYAAFLGMSLPEDVDFLWIAREGLKAPLPLNWKVCMSDSGEIFYFNFDTGECSWDHPLDQHFRLVFRKHQKGVREVRELRRQLMDSEKQVETLNKTVSDLIASLQHVQSENSRLKQEMAGKYSGTRFTPLRKTGSMLRKELKEIKQVLIQAVRTNSPTTSTDE
jgi:hypothetical protein